MRVLRKRVTDMGEGVHNELSDVKGQISSVNNNLDQQADAQRKVSGMEFLILG